MKRHGKRLVTVLAIAGVLAVSSLLSACGYFGPAWMSPIACAHHMFYRCSEGCSSCNGSSEKNVEHSDRGYDAGYDDGYAHGFNDGRDGNGFGTNYAAINNGNEPEYSAGYESGYNDGYEEGCDAAAAENTKG